MSAFPRPDGRLHCPERHGAHAHGAAVADRCEIAGYRGRLSRLAAHDDGGRIQAWRSLRRLHARDRPQAPRTPCRPTITLDTQNVLQRRRTRMTIPNCDSNARPMQMSALDQRGLDDAERLGARVVVAQPRRKHLDQREVLAERAGLRDLLLVDAAVLLPVSYTHLR